MEAEFSERETLWRNRRPLKPYDIVVIIDELPMLHAWYEAHKKETKDKPTLFDVITKILLELRKMHVYVLLAGQGFPHTILSTISRNNTSSRLIFPTSENFAKMAGLEVKYIKSMLPAIEDTNRGAAILDVSTRKKPVIISIPETQVTDLVSIIEANEMYAELNRRFALTA